MADDKPIFGIDPARVTAIVVDPPYGFSAREFAERNRTISIPGRRQGKTATMEDFLAPMRRNQALMSRARRLVMKGDRRGMKRARRLLNEVCPHPNMAKMHMASFVLQRSLRRTMEEMQRAAQAMARFQALEFQLNALPPGYLDRLGEIYRSRPAPRVPILFPQVTLDKFPTINIGVRDRVYRIQDLDMDLVRSPEFGRAAELERELAKRAEDEFRQRFLEGFGRAVNAPYEAFIKSKAIEAVYAIAIEPPKCEECGLPIEECNRRAQLRRDGERFRRWARLERRIIDAAKGS